jgi:WhiB family redox-sensing transcriptional regulator
VCRTVDPELWFPETNSLGLQAKKFCASCPVVEECLQYALENNEKHGIWGGLSRSQRILLRRRRGMTRRIAI